MKPALVVNDLRKGGAERLVVDLALELDGYDNVEPIVIIANPIGELVSTLEQSDVELVSLGTSVSTVAIPQAILRLSRVLRDREIDVVHSHLPFSHVVGRFACARLRIPHVSTYHNVASHKTPPKRLAERVTSRFSDRIVCVSEGVRQSYPDSVRTMVIYNGIDVEAFNERVEATDASELEARHNGETVFLNVARCVEQKRQEDLVKVMALLENEEAADDTHLYIVGDGPRREAIEEMVERRDVSDHVTVTGYVDEIEPYFAVADVFVSASSNEGLPTTHLEAMAAKLPIVSTIIPGVEEVVEQSETGLLCPVGDYDCFKNAVCAFASNKRLLRFGNKGFERAKSKYSMHSVLEQYIELYAEV